ncbi:unnamed protein product [Rotaria sp. Silwood1]|nr:unnamed protein product [Rotaria sp. Silwood1]
MQSVDEFTPSTTEPVFGSGLVSQTKTQASTNNENSDNEKVAPSSESVTNGPNDTTNDTENATNGTENTTNSTTESVTENIDAGDSTAVHGNSQSEKPTVETMNETKPTEEPIPVEKSEQVELTVPSTTEPEPVLSTSIDTTNEGSSTTIDTAPPPAIEAAAATTTTNDNVPEVPKPSDSETTEPKSKTPRSKPKTSVVSTTPTRHSARGRKTASSSSTNIEENQTNDDTGATTTTTTTNQNESSKRIKRQAATIAKDAITASNQPNSTSDDGNDQDVIPSDGDEDDDVTGNKSKKSSPTGRKKRRASASPTSVTKKTKGKNSITSTSNIDNEGKKVQTPPKRARTSSPKKTPEPPSEEYVRKLRPRK